MNSQFNSSHICFHISSCSTRLSRSFNIGKYGKNFSHLIIHKAYILYSNNLRNLLYPLDKILHKELVYL